MGELGEAGSRGWVIVDSGCHARVLFATIIKRSIEQKMTGFLEEGETHCIALNVSHSCVRVLVHIRQQQVCDQEDILFQASPFISELWFSLPKGGGSQILKHLYPRLQ